jgi:hypothetical protein
MILNVKYTLKIKQTEHFKILGEKCVFNNITGEKKGKVHPCTRIEALYRLHGP